MKRLLFLALILCLVAVAPVAAFRDSMQGYDTTSGGTGGITPITPTTLPSLGLTGSTGEVVLASAFSLAPQILLYSNPTTAFTYAAFDLSQGGYPYFGSTITLYDSSLSPISSIYIPVTINTHSHYEVKIIGGTPTLFGDGTQIATGAQVSVNPSYLQITGYGGGYSNNLVIDNIVMAETDHHVIGSIPTNWSIQRDFLNPSATGVYGLTLGGGSTWTLQNSQSFYIDADTDSTDAVTTENLQITNMATGIIVNTTAIDSTVPKHQISYDLTQFFSNPNVLDGEYSVAFNGSTVQEYLWVISNGAGVTWDKTTYTVGDTANLNYTITGGKWLPSTYSYSYKIVDAYDTQKATGTLSTQTGSFSVPLTTGTYIPGAYYAEIIATQTSDSSQHLMAYSGTTLTDYITFSGLVYDAPSAALLSGALINITQAGTSTTHAITTDGTGTYSATGYLTGSSISITGTKSGYTTYSYTFTPLSATEINLNIALEPTSPSISGIAIGGVARDKTYGQLIPSATISVKNTTTSESYTETTNAAGWYLCDNGHSCSLVNTRLYAVQGSATGYNNSPVYQVVVSGS